MVCSCERFAHVRCGYVLCSCCDAGDHVNDNVGSNIDHQYHDDDVNKFNNDFNNCVNDFNNNHDDFDDFDDCAACASTFGCNSGLSRWKRCVCCLGRRCGEMLGG